MILQKQAYKIYWESMLCCTWESYVYSKGVQTFEKGVRFYMIKFVAANLGWIFLQRATYIQKNFNKLFRVHSCFFISFVLLIYSMTEVAGQMKFDQGARLARGPDFADTPSL